MGFKYFVLGPCSRVRVDPGVSLSELRHVQMPATTSDEQTTSKSTSQSNANRPASLKTVGGVFSLVEVGKAKISPTSSDTIST